MSDSPDDAFDFRAELKGLYQEAAKFDDKLKVLQLMEKVGGFVPVVKDAPQVVENDPSKPDPAAASVLREINGGRA